MQEITIPWTPVKALLHLAGKADIRGWVKAVWIDQRGPRVVVMATTGTVLGALQTEEPSTNTGSWCLPRHILEACRDFAVSATVKREDDGRMSISCMGTTHYWKDEGFAMTDWRRVIPRGQADGKARQFDATLLAPFVKVREALRGKKSEKIAGGVLLAHHSTDDSGADGLLVQLLDLPEFVGVLMPLHEDSANAYLRTSAPDWVREIGRVETPAEAADLV